MTITKKNKLSKMNIIYLYGTTAIIILEMFLLYTHSKASEIIEEPIVLISTESIDSNVVETYNTKNGIFSIDQKTNFNIKAHIKPIQTKKNEILSSKVLQIADTDFICRGRNNCIKRMEFNFEKKPVQIDNFPNLQIIWKQEIVENTPEIIVNTEIINNDNIKNNKIKITGYFSEGQRLSSKPVKLINMKNTTFDKISYSYLIKRELGIQADKTWRYRSENERTILQARVDLPLKLIHTVKLAIESKYHLERIQFSIDTDGSGKRDCFILSEQTRNSKEKKGNLIIHTVDLSPAIEKLDIDIEKAVLLEPIIFVNTDPDTFLKEKPIQKIAFYNASKKNEHKKAIIPSVYKNGHIYSLDFDLRQALHNSLNYSAMLKKLNIQIRSDAPQAIEFKKIVLFKSVEKKVPLVTTEPTNALRFWIKDLDLIFQDPLVNIKSFRPLTWIWNDTQKKIFHSSFDKKVYEDHDIRTAISGDNHWYRIHKAKRSIHLQGIYSGNNSLLRLYIKPRRQSSWLNFQAKNINIFTIDESLDKNTIERPTISRVQNRKIFLKKNKPVSLIISPDNFDQNLNKKSSIISKEWELILQILEDDTFLKTEYTQENKYYEWFSKENIVDGDLVANYEGVGFLGGSIRIEDMKHKYSSEISLYENDTPKLIPITDKAKFLGFKNNDYTYTNRKSMDYNVTFFDIIRNKYRSEFDLKSIEWWDKTAEVKLMLNNYSMETDIQNEFTYLFPNQQKIINKWTFFLPNVEFIAAYSLLMCEDLPPYCSAHLNINGQKIPIPFGSSEFFLNTVTSPIKNFTFELEYTGQKKLLKIKTPSLRVIGLKRTVFDEFNEPVISIDGKNLPFNFNSKSYSEGEWIDLGSVSLNPGVHFVNIKNSPFFKVNTFILQSEKMVSLKSDKHDYNEKIFIPKKTFTFSLKLFFIFFMFGIIYYYRKNKIKNWDRLLLIISKHYCILPDKVWVIIWSISAAGVYGFAINYNFLIDNYFFTFGGLFMIISFWHMSNYLKNKIYKQFPKIGNSIYKGKGTPFFAGAIILLVLTASFVCVNLNKLAEQSAIIVYFFLITGTILEIISFKRKA
jgi:hypothetical protein